MMCPYLHIQLSSFGALKSLDKNVIIIFLLSILHLFCIKETIHYLFDPHFRENVSKIFPIWAFF